MGGTRHLAAAVHRAGSGRGGRRADDRQDRHPQADKLRNPIERMFRRLKDRRRIATRYDKLATNFAAAIAIAAIVNCSI